MDGKYSRSGSHFLTAAVAGIYLVLCLVLGGASRDNANWNGVLQVTGLLALAVAAASREKNDPPSRAWPLAAMFAVVVWFGAASLIPVPSELWSKLPGRENVTAAFDAIGAQMPWLPVSLTPAETLSGLLNFVPPFVLFMLACWMTGAYGLEPLAWIILAVAFGSLGLGVAQVYSAATTDLYLYPISNRGLPAGIFANVNHQATLLLIAIPFASALFRRLHARTNYGASGWEKTALALIAILGLAVGVLITGSIAGYVLLLPVMVAAAIIASTGGTLRVGASLTIFVGGFVLVAAVMAASPFVLSSGTSFDNGPLSRLTIFQNTWRAVEDFMPAGAGLGSFESVYTLYENPHTPALQFVNHAHSDALEILLELGAVGAVLALCFLIWYLQRSARIWAQSPGHEVVFEKAATVAVAVVLLHSIVDYPLRTVAISVLFALGAAIMVRAAPKDGGVNAKSDEFLRALVM